MAEESRSLATFYSSMLNSKSISRISPGLLVTYLCMTFKAFDLTVTTLSLNLRSTILTKKSIVLSYRLTRF